MRFSRFLIVFSVFFALMPQAAQAKSWIDWIIPPPIPDFEKPYLNDAKTPHQAIYRMDPWVPEDWTRNRGGQKGVMDDLYISHIIRDQYVEDDVPVIQVGQRFMELSGNDKRRVIAYIDSVYGITAHNENAAIILHHWKKCDTVGVYTKAGLQLQ